MFLLLLQNAQVVLFCTVSRAVLRLSSSEAGQPFRKPALLRTSSEVVLTPGQIQIAMCVSVPGFAMGGLDPAGFKASQLAP